MQSQFLYIVRIIRILDFNDTFGTDFSLKIMKSKDNAWNQSKAYDMQYYHTLLRKIIVVITF